MEGWLTCTISSGQFTGEYSVRGKLFDDSEFSLFAPEEDLQFPQLPTPEGSVEGLIRIMTLDRKQDLVLVALPRSSFENGQTITVKANLVR